MPTDLARRWPLRHSVKRRTGPVFVAGVRPRGVCGARFEELGGGAIASTAKWVTLVVTARELP
jgi:hypothetical protein